MADRTPKTNANTLIVAAIVVATLYIGQVVLIPLALAVLLAFVLSPLVRMLRKVSIPKTVAVMVVVLLAFSVLLAAGFMVSRQVTVLAENIPRYEFSMRKKIRELRGATVQNKAMKEATETLEDLGKELSKKEDETKTAPAAEKMPREEPEEAKPIPVEIHEPPTPVFKTYRSIVAALIHPLAMTGLVFLFLSFILLQRQDLRDRFIRLTGAHDLERTTVAMVDAAERLSRYFLLQTALNAVFGVWIGIGLWLIGVPNPILWAGLAFLMRYVPFIGSFLAAGFPLILAAAVDPTWVTFLWTLALYLFSEPFMGHVVEPMVFGHNTGLSPFAVVVAVTFWTALWGPIGLILAIPLTLTLVTTGRHVERLSFLDVLFGDQPALSAPERFYQRALANDPEEATELAESLLKEHSLVTLYDDVLIESLILAQDDVDRGALESSKLSTIAETVATITDDLAYVADATPAKDDATDGEDEEDLKEAPDKPDIPILAKEELNPEWRTKCPVLCLSGRSPLDRSAAELFGQLLAKHGLPTKLISRKDLNIKELEKSRPDDVKAVVLSYLSVGRRSAHIKSVVARLRKAYPDALIVAGLWGNDGYASATDKTDVIGSDIVVHSLRDALETCINAATADSPKTKKIASK